MRSADAADGFRALAETVACSWPAPAAEVELRHLISEVERQWPDDLKLFRSNIYRELAKRGVAQSLMEEIASRIEHDGSPIDTASQVHWAALLANTPCRSLVVPVIDGLLHHPERFAVGSTECRALEPFLDVMIQVLPPSCLEECFECLINWAANLPPIVNEDWRGFVFGALLRAVNSLPLQLRHATWVMIAHRAAAVLPEEKILDISLTEDDITTAQPAMLDAQIELMLKQAEQDPESAYGAVLAMALRVAAGAGPMLSDTTARRICDSLTRHAGKACKVRYLRLAHIVKTCPNTSLHSYLARILELTDEEACMQSLSSEDLEYLLYRPVAWWVEHSARMTTESSIPGELLKWIEAVSRRVPDAAPAAITLASVWLGRGDPCALSGFWFNLANHPMPLASAVRQGVAKAAG